MKNPIFLAFALFVAGIAAAQAQKPPVTTSTVTSEPGKASIVSTAEVTAIITAIDKTTRTVTLKGPNRTVDLVAGEEVRNFDQLKLGDRVAVKYVESLALELKKARGPQEPKVDSAALRAKPGDRPGGVVAREVTVLADVVAVDPKKSTISLKGPRGDVVDLKVQNPDQFKVVKVGDQVEVVYTVALAVSVTPAPKVEAAKK